MSYGQRLNQTPHDLKRALALFSNDVPAIFHLPTSVAGKSDYIDKGFYHRSWMHTDCLCRCEIWEHPKIYPPATKPSLLSLLNEQF